MADRTVLVCGATGGLGAAVVDVFAADGWRVVGTSRRAGDDDAGSGGERGESVAFVTADLADPREADRAVEAAAGDPAAPLRAVAHVVGGFAAGQLVAETPVEAFEAQFALNLRPLYLVCQAALPRLAAAGGGAICCVSSKAAFDPFAGAAGYCASKAALVTLARVVAREGAKDGVRCNVVVPSQIATPLMLESTPPEKHGALVPPADIAQAILHLCGPGSAATNGAVIPVYGAAA